MKKEEINQKASDIAIFAASKFEGMESVVAIENICPLDSEYSRNLPLRF